MTQTDFARVCGLHKQQISDWERNKFTPTISSIRAISETTGANIDWLASGIGNSGLENATNSVILNSETIKKIPVLGSVPAGYPLPAAEALEPVGFMMTDCQAAELAVTVSGDSMSPTILDGDLAAYYFSTEWKHGDVVVCRDEWGDHVLKRIKVDPDGRPWLVSDNPHYPKMQPNGFAIVGVVCDVRRKVKFR